MRPWCKSVPLVRRRRLTLLLLLLLWRLLLLLSMMMVSRTILAGHWSHCRGGLLLITWSFPHSHPNAIGCHSMYTDGSIIPITRICIHRHKGSLAGSCSILNVHNFIILFLSQIKWSWMAGGHNMEDLWGWRGPGFPTGPVDVHGGRSTKLHRGGQPPPADAASCWFRILITARTGGCGIATRAPYIQPWRSYWWGPARTGHFQF